MVTDINKVCKMVAARRSVFIDISPFYDTVSTLVTVSCVKDTGEVGETSFEFEPDLLACITDTDLRDYLVTQIDRFCADLPVQNIRVEMS